MARTYKDGNRVPAAFTGNFFKAMIDPDVVPIWDDPNYFCRSCKRSYSSKQSHRAHVKRVHNAVVEKSKQLSMSSNPT